MGPIANERAPTSPPSLRQLTSSGCCVNPFWSPDGAQVLFIDRPGADAPVGLWGVRLEAGDPELYTERLGLYSAGMQLMAYLEEGETIVEHLIGGQRWVIPNGGRSVLFSPDGSLVAWTVGAGRPPFDTSQGEVWASQVDGSQPRLVARLNGGGLAGWFPDGRLLLLGRTQPGDGTGVFMSVDSVGSDLREIARGHRLRSGLLSPNGSWLAYQAVFGDDPDENGLWIADTLTGERRRLDYFGAYRWRDDGRLLLIPQDFDSERHRLLQVEAASGAVVHLTDPAVTPFKVANGDWAVSPDGRYTAFVSADDGNFWSLTLP